MIPPSRSPIRPSRGRPATPSAATAPATPRWCCRSRAWSLVAPPVINLFLADLTVLGAPLLAVYLFAVWGLLILAARLLARRLREDDPR